MFTLTIETDNAAFEDDGDELAEILVNLARYSASLPERGTGVIRDSNGNTVGYWQYDKDVPAGRCELCGDDGPRFAYGPRKDQLVCLRCSGR